MVIFAATILGLLVFVFVFLKVYKPVPDRLRSLVYRVLSNYSAVGYVADITRNNKLVWGYFAEDIVKHPENLETKIIDTKSLSREAVDSSVVPSFHKDLVNWNGRVVGADRNNLTVVVDGVKYVVKIRGFSLMTSVDIGQGAPVISELGPVRERIEDLVEGRVISLVVYRVAGRYELLSATIL